MDRVRLAAQVFFYMAGGCLFAVLVYYAWLAGPGIYKASLAGEGIHQASLAGPELKPTAQAVHATVLQLARTVGTMRHTVNKVNAAADEQIAYLKAQEQSTLETTKSVSAQVAKVGEVADSAQIMLNETNVNLNRHLLPQIAVIASHADQTIQSLTGEVKSAQKATESLNQAITQLNLKWIANPKLNADVTGMFSDVHGITTDAKIEADKFVAPKKWYQKVWSGVKMFGIQVGGAALGASL